MTTETARLLLERMDLERGACSVAAREQTALVWSLVDEIDRRDSSGENSISLCEQLDEEVARLGHIVRFDGPSPS